MAKTLLVACALSLAAATTVASASASRPLARELAAAMLQQKLEAIAAVDPADPTRFAAALVFPEQLLVVAARHPSATALVDQLARKAYRDVYAALHGAAVPETKFFVQDMGADGLDNTGESVDVVYVKVVEQLIFDGHPEKHKMSKAAYAEKFQQADDQYSHLLKLLLDAAKATAT
jgi:hypothetical protein